MSNVSLPRICSDPVAVSVPEKSRLDELFAGILAYVEQNDLPAALRLSDCASRIAPDDAKCALVHARLLIELGLPHHALRRLTDRGEPDAIVERAYALHLLGEHRQATELCETLLTRFAVDSVGRLRGLASTLCRAESQPELAGWVAVNVSVHLEGEARRDSPLKIMLDNCSLSARISDADQGDFYSFTVEVPNGSAGRISIAAGTRRFLGSDFMWPPAFGLAGWVMAQDHGVAGKIRMDWAPDLPITLRLQCAGKDLELRTILQPPIAFSDSSTGTPFQIELAAGEVGSAPLHVSAVLPDGSYTSLIGSPVILGASSPGSLEPQSTILSPKFSSKIELSRVVDIVVPVYAGYDETLCCLHSILTTIARTEAEIVVVNDASPDSRLCTALDGLARDGLITVLTNASNLGFPGAANAGMNLHPDRDVVLVNSDVELFGDWLERLRSVAFSSSDIGTVTPLGQAASILSYPGNDVTRYTGAEAREIDRIAREVNTRQIVDLPVGVGFCLYVKRACLTEAGAFNEVAFGKGYGEENDFCLRASRLGWRHVGATNLFVRHQGATSFDARKAALMERNALVLNALHPGYDAKVARFLAADPLLNARRAIDMQRLVSSAKDTVLLVTCNLQGGVKRHVDTRKAALAAQGHTVLVLRPANFDLPAKQVTLYAPNEDIKNLLFFVPQDLGILRNLLLLLDLKKIELHHFAGLPDSALELAANLGVRYEVFVHDYSWICPRLTLANGNDAYCGEPPVEDCESCIRNNGTFLDEALTVEALRTRSARIMNGADRVIVPSKDVRTRLERYFPGRSVDVLGWEKPIASPLHTRLAPNGAVRVAVIGAISIPKGFRVILDCIQDAIKRKLDVEFIVIGFTCNDDALLATGRAFVTGPYSDDEVASLLAREQCHVAFFPAVVPETWCYALTHALVEELPVLAFDLGTIAERLGGYGHAQVLPLCSPATAINEALLRLARVVSVPQSLEVAIMDTHSTVNTSSADGKLQTSVQFLPLPPGTYTITVKDGVADEAAPGELVLPAVQAGVSPTKSEGTIEFLARGGTIDRWLVRRRDMIVARISGGEASLMLTSVSLLSSPSLGIDIQRLDPDSLFEYPETEPGIKQAMETADLIPAQIVAHIHRVGDVPFRDGLAGCIGDGLWIEAFAIGPFGQLTPDLIEYCGVTADGYQTPWLDNQTLCGSRGRSIPMVGCAIRLKPGISERYDCEYTGQFVSGRVLGPFKNGDLCCSDIPSDPLWGFELFAVERAHAAPETSLS